MDRKKEPLVVQCVGFRDEASWERGGITFEKESAVYTDGREDLYNNDE